MTRLAGCWAAGSSLSANKDQRGYALLRLPIRGGNWNNGATAGLRALNLNNPRTNANSNIGARPALGYVRNQMLTGY